jgi:folate-dependent phosphoribosylglycinamide formyltransferase PurN
MLIQIVLEISQRFNGYFRHVFHHSIVTGPLVSRMDIMEQGVNERCTAKAVLELYDFLCLQMCGYMVWLQDGVKETGVSVAYTVQAMDSGPIIASGHMDVDPDIKVSKVVNFNRVTKTM